MNCGATAERVRGAVSGGAGETTPAAGPRLQPRNLTALARCRDHRVHEAHQVLADALHPDALDARLRALEQEVELVGGELGLGEAGLTTELEDARVLAPAVLVDRPSRRVVHLGQLGEGVEDGRAALLHLRERLPRAAAPAHELRAGITGVLGDDLVPRRLLLRDEAAHPLGDELV